MANTKHFGALAAAAGALVAVALLILMMLVWVNPQAAEAAFSGFNGRIAYSSFDGGDFEIFTIPVPASGEPPGTPNQVTFSSGSLSPSFTVEGRRIAYSSGRAYPQIYTIPANGGEPDRVTTIRRPNVDPDYSPDGQRIVYSARLRERPNGPLGDYEILTISATGGSSSGLTSNGTDDLDPVYSPDGSRIAYSSRDGDGDFEIFTMPATGVWPRHQVTHNSRDDIQPSWLPRVGGTTVPNVVGFSSSSAGREIRKYGLVPEFTGDPPGANAWVWSQRPNAGTLVDPGSTVTCRLTNEGDVP